MTVTSERATFSLRTLPAEDFPRLPEPADDDGGDAAGEGVCRDDRAGREGGLA